MGRPFEAMLILVCTPCTNRWSVSELQTTLLWSTRTRTHHHHHHHHPTLQACIPWWNTHWTCSVFFTTVQMQLLRYWHQAMECIVLLCVTMSHDTWVVTAAQYCYQQSRSTCGWQRICCILLGTYYNNNNTINSLRGNKLLSLTKLS